MKKQIFFLLTLAASVSVSAQQEFKKVKIGVGVGYAAFADEQAKGSGLVYLEPAYRINDMIAVGLRVEAFSTNFGSSSFSLNGQYYFNKYNLRGFIGGGIGLYMLKDFAPGVESKSKIGIYPRVGFDFGNLNMYVDYNILPSANSESAEVKSDYLGLHAGISLGGGRYRGARRR